MFANKEVEKKIKKIRIFNELLLAFGRNKIIFKQLDDEKHYTMKFLKEGILDVHETIEGKEKRYPRTENFDLKKLSEKIKETLREELPNILREIDIGDPKYTNVEVLIIPKEGALQERVQKATKIKRKEMMIEKSKLEDAMEDLILPMKDLQNYDFKVAFLLREGEELNLLYRIKGKYFLITLDNLEKLMNKIFEKSKILRN